MMNAIEKLYYFLLEHAINVKFLKSPADEYIFAKKKKSAIVFLTVAFNNPYVLDLQLQLIKKNITDDFCHIILDNSSNKKIRDYNKMVCNTYGVTWISLPNNPWTGIHNSRSHGISLNWGIQHILPKFCFNVVGFLDHDIFPVSEHSLLEAMNDKILMGQMQVRGNCWYLWPGFLFMRSSVFKNGDISMLPTRSMDTGGALWKRLYANMNKADVAWVVEKEELLRAGESRQDSCYYLLGDWVHTVNASYWKECTPKEDTILDVLRVKANCPELSPSMIATHGISNRCV